MKRVLLCVDLSYQTYRAAAAHPKLQSVNGEFTGGLYGFLMTLAKIIRDVDASHVIVAQDSKPYLRSRIYPEYKLIRKKAQDPELKARFEFSKPLVLQALECIGIPTIAVPGYEFDDIAGHYAKRFYRRFDAIVAASNDSDLFQLLDYRNFSVYRKDETDIMTAARLMLETGLHPWEYSLASALMGTHNDVEGIARCGPVNAYKALREPALLRKYMDTHGPLIERNKQLIKLPMEGFPGCPLPLPTKAFSQRSLYKFFARYDITATKSMLDAFEKVCPP